MYIASRDENDHLAVAYELQKHLEPLLLVSSILLLIPHSFYCSNEHIVRY